MSIVSNIEYREILLRDYSELRKCFENNLYKSTIVLSGSILEAVLIEYYVSTGNSEKEANEVTKLKLFQLIDKAANDNLISERAKNLSSVVRDYRNYSPLLKKFEQKIK
ncbi:MAG: DUF4145 domain-containing protein [Saprospiraceae bacterium]|nr:DUF4145 domain-containing protein [Saprospiraceae bacterium]